VARLAIAKSFMAEYARLDADARRAVEALVTEFARRPHAWRYLEKPRQGRDDRVRLFRVNSLWRGVVLAPDSGDTYCLVTILPHEKAFAFAAGHRFSVNQALGVLETRDEQAIQQLRPALQSAASRPDGRRLFGDVTDEDLTRLGVDSQVLALVRLLASEADLERLQLALPDAQYGVLYALASGMTVEEAWAELARLAPGGRPPERVDQHDLVSAMERSSGEITFVNEKEELPLILARPFAAWRTFLHPAQRDVAYRPSYAGPAQVTGGPGTGKTVTVLHRAAFLAARAATSPQEGPPVLVTTFSGSLAEALESQLDLLIGDPAVRRLVEVLTVDRLAWGVVSRARGNPVIAGQGELRSRWARAAEQAGLAFSPAFLTSEWEQVILARDLRTEQAYRSCPRAGRGRPLTRAQRGQVWQAAQRVTAELAAAGESTPLQLASEAAGLLGQPGPPRYRHILVDEAQDLHLAQWRLLRAAAAPGPDDLFIAADPHQRIYDSRVSLASLGISVRGRSRRLSLNYRTTEEILAWTVPLLGDEPVTGLDDEVDSLLGYRSPTRGQRPQLAMAASRAGEFAALAARIRGWLNTGIEPPAIGVAARSAGLARQAREALQADGIMTVPLRGRGDPQAVRVGTMHAMKGLEFQAVAVIGVEQGGVPAPAALTPEAEDAATRAQDLQRERCVLFAACTRARDQLFVSGTGEPSPFLPREGRHQRFSSSRTASARRS
jgi:superfamily I DNA/RNA helicase